MDFAGEEFWDTWYKNIGHNKNEQLRSIDWYEGYQGLKLHLDKYVSKEIKENGCFLIVGCGNSPLAEEMVADGYCPLLKGNEEGARGQLFNIDFSETVIAEMRDRYPKKENVVYHVADVCDLSKVFVADSVDVVIDKGCIDSMLCSASSSQIVSSFFQEMKRILKPAEQGGLFIVVSANEQALGYLTSAGWKVVAEDTLVRKGPTNDSYAPKDCYHFFLVTK